LAVEQRTYSQRVTVDVYALVQDPHDVDDIPGIIGVHPVEQRVRPGGELAIARADFVACAANSGVYRYAPDRVSSSRRYCSAW